MPTNTWRVQPILSTIIEILEEKGSMTDEELKEILEAFYKDLGYDNFNRTLMTMEITGLINVSNLKSLKFSFNIITFPKK